MHERWGLIITSPLQSHQRAQRKLCPFFLRPENPIPLGSNSKSQGWAHPRSLSFLIQVLRQIIHQLEGTPTIDHLVDQIAFAAR